MQAGSIQYIDGSCIDQSVDVEHYTRHKTWELSWKLN